MKAEMKLALDLSWAHFQGRWSKAGSWTGRIFPDLDVFKEAVSMAERGLFDLIFFGDNIGIPNIYRGRMDEAVKYGVGFPRHDMSSTIAALSQYSKNVGFGLTYSSTFMHPFYTARLLNALDHISGGRIAFNVVASTRRGNAANFGMDQLMDHNSRYERMEEFVDVCKKLWASVPADAFVWDRESGIVIDKPERIQAINHVGEFFKVKGPLPCVPSPQGRPMLIQAGGSPRGVKASANFADYVFASHKPGKGMAKHRADLDVALKAEGRDASKVGILWSTYILVGETEAEALRAKEGLLKMMPMEGAAATISDSAGWDFSTLPNRFKLKEINDEIAATNASPVGIVYKIMQQLGEDAEITREEFYEYAMLSASGYDHCVAGTAAQVADVMEELFEETGSRGGFMISSPPSIPRDLLNIVDFLVPELQRRGRYRKEYKSTLLKENLEIAA